jgi:hypothetical protein
VVFHVEHVQQGRFLHRFPHNKVRFLFPYLSPCAPFPDILTLCTAWRLLVCHHFPPVHRPTRNWRRSLRHPLAP